MDKMTEKTTTNYDDKKKIYQAPELTEMGSLVDNTMGGFSGTNDANGPQNAKDPQPPNPPG